MDRPLPQPDQDTEFFWEGLRRRELLIQHCDECGHWIHYPKPACPRCGGTRVKPKAVSGRGVVHTYTVT
ncbi:MAG: Zn-ribbon domain-containing OB-fold protein, partial [Actinomycetota bacterium]